MTDEYETMTVPELKDLLRERGLKVGGNKSELIARLLDNEDSDDTESTPVVSDAEVEEFDDDFDDEFDEDDDFFEDDDWDNIHTARQKPVLDEETAKALAFRAQQKKKQPAFRRQEWYRYKRLSRSSWRKPNGLQSKMRLKLLRTLLNFRCGF